MQIVALKHWDKDDGTHVCPGDLVPEAVDWAPCWYQQRYVAAYPDEAVEGVQSSLQSGQGFVAAARFDPRALHAAGLAARGVQPAPASEGPVAKSQQGEKLDLEESVPPPKPLPYDAEPPAGKQQVTADAGVTPGSELKPNEPSTADSVPTVDAVDAAGDTVDATDADADGDAASPGEDGLQRRRRARPTRRGRG